MRTVTLPVPGSTKNRETIDYVVVEELPTLVWLANLAALELHVPQWRVPRRARKPRTDIVVFDLDPGPPATIVECCEVAVLLRAVLAEDGLTPFPKTSGSKGMQVSAPVEVADPDLPSRYAHAVAERLEADRPDLIVSRMAKSLRPRKVFVDWSQNNPAKTTVAPYSLRARPLPTVSTPLTWDEVESGEHLSFTAGEVLDRVDEYGDLFARRRRTPGCAPASRPRWSGPGRLRACPSRSMREPGYGRAGRPDAPVGTPQATARGRPGGVRRQRLPRRRDGRHRRPRRRVQTGAVPALPGQARPLPRAARHPGRGADRRRSSPRWTGTPTTGRASTSVLSAYFDFVDRDDEAGNPAGAFRLIFESDLNNDPEVRKRVESVTQKTMEAVADAVAPDTGLGRDAAELLATALTGSAQVVARWWLAKERPVSQEEAVHLLEALLWRGISNFPLHATDPATHPI